MVQGAMVLSMGVHVGTLFQLDVFTIQCISCLIFAVERSIGSTHLQLEHISTSNGHSFWVPKPTLALEIKLPT